MEFMRFEAPTGCLESNETCYEDQNELGETCDGVGNLAPLPLVDEVSVGGDLEERDESPAEPHQPAVDFMLSLALGFDCLPSASCRARARQREAAFVISVVRQIGGNRVESINHWHVGSNGDHVCLD